MDLSDLAYYRTINKLNNNSNNREAFLEELSNEFDDNYTNIIDQFEVEVNTSKGTEVVRNLNIKDRIRVLLTLENAKTSTETKYYAKVQCWSGDLKTGDYISFTSPSGRKQTLLIASVPELQHNYDKHEVLYALNCNQTINRKNFPYPLPCNCDNSSYGVKGEVEVGSFAILDGKMKVHMQRNKYSDMFIQNERVLFDGDENSVYEVVDISSATTPSLRRLILNKVEYKEGYDDLSNNIAWNIWDDDTGETVESYSIISSTGKYEILKYSTVAFSVAQNVRSDINWNITVNTDNIGNDWVSVIDITSNSITLKNIKGYHKEGFEVIFTDPISKTVISQKIRVVNY